jgi:hypothetical protein
MGITEDTGKHGDYVSYLLRMWQESEKGAVWRASLQSPHTGALVGFARLDDLFDFLRGQVGLEPAADKVQNEE